MDDLENTDKQITVIGQIIDLRLSSHKTHFWEWTKDYLMLDASSQNEMLTHHQLCWKFPLFWYTL